MFTNPFSKSGIIIIVLVILLPIIFSLIEYFLAKRGSEKGMFILPVVILFTAFIMPLYGIVFAAIVLSVGLITRHIRKNKLSELKKMSIEDLNENKKNF